MNNQSTGKKTTLLLHGFASSGQSTKDRTSETRKVQLSEVEEDHNLNNHLDCVWEYVQSFLLNTGTRR
jgi:hypothetical protein